MNNPDPILEEIYQARQELWKAAGGDMGRLFEMLRAHQAASGKKVVTRKPRRIASPPATVPAK